MIFWDSSAIVPLVLSESNTDRLERVLKEDRDMVVWWGTALECLSAVARAERNGEVKVPEADRGRAGLSTLRGGWTEITPSEEVRERAETLLLRHPLTAADALQLAAALTWAEGRPGDNAFLTLDRRLASAARGEGFRLPFQGGMS